MNRKARDELRATLFWLRSVEEEAANGCTIPRLITKYSARAREHLDNLLVECFGEVIEKPETAEAIP